MKSDSTSYKQGMTLKTVILIFAVLGISTFLFSQSEKGIEHELKATFIYNFTKYIQWPNFEAYESFNIGVLGDSPIIESLREIAKRKTVGNKKMMIKHLNNKKDIHDCQILFISESMRNEVVEILKEIGDGHILTIADSEGMARQGIATNFVIQKDKIKFELNIRAIQRADLVVSSQLQKLAIMVEEET